jgi:putative component of toxin-antitoxin plasmid stabilization module
MIGGVWKSPLSLEQGAAQVAAIASPEPHARRQDGDVQELKDIPEAKLSQEDRWRVAEALWLESITPKLMICKSLESLSLQSALASVRSLASSGDAPELTADSARKSLAEVCGLLSCHLQDAPMTADQVRGLRSLFAPEDAANHIKILSQLIDDEWRAALKTAMSFSIHEAQSASDLAALFEGLQGSGADDAWGTLLKRWPNWRETLRPRTLQRIVEQAQANIEKRLQAVRNGDVEGLAAAGEGLALVRLTTEFAQMVHPQKKEEWVMLGLAAKRVHRSSTAEHSWREFLDACKKVEENSAQDADPAWAETVAKAVSQCDICEGMVSREEDHPAIIAAIRGSFKAKDCSEASLSLPSRLAAFLPSVVEPELRKMAAASLTASRLVGHGVPESATGSDKPVVKPTLVLKKALEEFDSVVKVCPRLSEIAAWPAVEAIMASVALECSTRAASEADAALAAWQQAIANLAAQVARCDWKARLPTPSEVAWPHVAREMEYKFWQSDENPLAQMDAAYDKAQGTKNQYAQICQAHGVAKDEALDAKHRQSSEAAQIINTEEYLARHLRDGSTAAASKIRKRLDQILELFPYDSLCPVIRKGVKDLTGL